MKRSKLWLALTLVECAEILYGGDNLAGRRWNSRGWNFHAMRERLFHLATQACLRL